MDWLERWEAFNKDNMKQVINFGASDKMEII